MKLRSYKKCASEYGTSEASLKEHQICALGGPPDYSNICKVCGRNQTVTKIDWIESFGLNFIFYKIFFCRKQQGDSGGPLVKISNGVQIGLSSFGQDCKSRETATKFINSVFTKIADNLDFINEATKNN